MKVLYSWLQEFIDLPEGVEEIARLLTFSGLEVEEIETIGHKGDWQGLVVAEVLEKRKHPNADRLSVTRVNAGNGLEFQVVCGAANVAEGQKVVLATVGTTLHPTKGEPFQIKSSKIRGEQSDGMLCAEDEIGYSANHDGIMVLPQDTPLGIPLTEALQPERDFLIHIGLTANRGDATSHLGVVRDLSALLNRDLKIQWLSLATTTEPSSFSVEIENSNDCGRYSGIEMSAVQVGPSPQWLQRKLEKIGIRSINNLVDISNYVMHHTGQPIHIFDADKITGKKVIVRRATQGESFKALDETEHQLSNENLIIADANGPIALAGVFGGFESGVSSETKNIFIESAWFHAGVVRKSARSRAYNTDASFRFERGTDPEITLKALHLTAALVAEIAGGTAIGMPLDLYPGKPDDKIVILPKGLITRMVGQEIPESDSETICRRLGMEILENNPDAWKIKVPHFKPDVERPIDIVEEIVRIYGYDKIEFPAYLKYAPDNAEEDPRFTLKDRLSDRLCAWGLLEIATNTLSKRSLYKGFDENHFVKILNPLSSDLEIMRPTAAYAGLEAIDYNKKRGSHNLRFFEFGKAYRFEGGKYLEDDFLCIWISGKFPAESWHEQPREADFFMLKGFVEKAFNFMGLDLYAIDISNGNFSRNPNAENPLFIGQFPPNVLKTFDVNAPVWMACMHWNSLAEKAVKTAFQLKPVSKFPEVKRDLSLVVDQNVSYRQLKNIAEKTLAEMLNDIRLFDIYTGDPIEAGKKAYALRFTLHNMERTLTDSEIEEGMNKLQKAFEKEAGAYLRK